MASARRNPNILVTGTPGVGKSTFSEQLASQCGLRYINIGELVKTSGFHDGYDEERHCHIIDEDKVLDELEPIMAQGGVIVDYHSSEFFPERFFDTVIVLRADTAVLYDRLQARNYPQSKIEEDVQCEIMNIVWEEAAESYKPEIIVVQQNDTLEQMSANLASAAQWVHEFRSRP
eukprot:TRINITY_DN1753_c0_g1_i3.p1 TRINITY_DN1753_c0_g1~~TRINITY_DN1753_c0_g1_i3.p1  ORF type:complete len:192 (-),score=8.58 TRINITY_DN1753_c0_g1_i3:182-706(-)